MELLPPVRQRFSDANNLPLVGGLLYSYEAGSATPKATYSNRAGSLNTNPIVLDANGECDLWVSAGYFKFVLKDVNSVVQWTRDNVSLASEASLASAFYRDVVYLTSADSPYTIAQGSNGKLHAVDTSGGAVTINLPEINAVVLPFNIAISLKTAGNNLTIARAGTDTISGATSKVISVAGTGCHLVGDIDKSPDQWEVVDLGTVTDAGVTSAKLAATVFSGLTEDTAPDPAADYFPSYDASAVANKKVLLARAHDMSVVAKTTTYLATLLDDVIKCSGSAFTVSLPAAASSNRKVLIIKKTDATLANIITIDPNSTELIDGASTITLNTLNESVTIVCNGVGWDIISHFSNISPTAYTPSFGTGFGTVTNASAHWTRRGSYLKVIGTCNPPGSGVGSNPYSISLPSGLSLDTNSLSINSNSLGSAGCIVGEGSQNTNSSSMRIATAPGTSTSLVYLCPNFTSSTANVPPSASTLLDNNGTFSFYFEVPISGWAG